MTAETARQFQALEAQASTLMNIFTSASYESVAPAIIQPADIFLNQVGESLRGRTYVFNAPDGEELCLRPDLTVPICRLYLERHPDASALAKYSYNGPAFRFQPDGRDEARRREFRQAGIENIGARDLGKAEAEVVSLVSHGVQACGLNDFYLRFGDLGLFYSLINALDIPLHWQMRLKQQFWRPQSFHELIAQLTDQNNSGSNQFLSAILVKLMSHNRESATEVVQDYLDSKAIPMIGVRNLEEITDRLLAQREDVKADPMPQDIANLIESYLAISGPPRAAGARIADLANSAQIQLDDALQTYMRRLDLFADAGISLANTTFNAEFGRNLEYYTGLVFQLEVPALSPPAGYIAGGGRYDNLIGDIGNGSNGSTGLQVPAVGSAVHTERLLMAVGGYLDDT